jgi:hypothetical protein
MSSRKVSSGSGSPSPTLRCPETPRATLEAWITNFSLLYPQRKQLTLVVPRRYECCDDVTQYWDITARYLCCIHVAFTTHVLKVRALVRLLQITRLFCYNVENFNPSQIARFAGAFTKILKSVCYLRFVRLFPRTSVASHGCTSA